MRQEAQETDAIVDGDDDDPTSRQAVTPIERNRSGFLSKSPTRNPHHHGQLLLSRFRRCPDAKRQAVLAHRFTFRTWDRDPRLHADGAEFISSPDSVPPQRGLRRPPAQFSNRRRRKRNRLVY